MFTRLHIQAAISFAIIFVAGYSVYKDPQSPTGFGALTTIAALWFPAPDRGES